MRVDLEGLLSLEELTTPLIAEVISRVQEELFASYIYFWLVETDWSAAVMSYDF